MNLKVPNTIMEHRYNLTELSRKEIFLLVSETFIIGVVLC